MPRDSIRLVPAVLEQVAHFRFCPDCRHNRRVVPLWRAISLTRDEALRGRTAIVIAHRLSTVMHADRIYVLDQGRALAEGTPQEIRGNLDVTAAYLGESAVQEDT